MLKRIIDKAKKLKCRIFHKPIYRSGFDRTSAVEAARRIRKGRGCPFCPVIVTFTRSVYSEAPFVIEPNISLRGLTDKKGNPAATIRG